MKNITYEKALKEIIEYFGYDKDLALSWYLTPNEDLDGLTPYQYIKSGKGQKLMKIIRNGLLSSYQ